MANNGLVKRICDTRTAGSIYGIFSVKSDYKSELPLQNLILCPPIPVDMEAMGISFTGVKFIRRGDWGGEPADVYDIWDYVGKPYSAVSFIEEALEMGTISRKFSPLLPFHLLTSESTGIFIAEAYIVNHYDVSAERIVGEDGKPAIRSCFKGNVSHDTNDGAEMCTSLLWEAMGPAPKGATSRVYIHHENSVEFKAAHDPSIEPQKIHAAFIRVPLTMFDIIEDKVENRHQAAVDLLSSLGGDFPFDFPVVEE